MKIQNTGHIEINLFVYYSIAIENNTKIQQMKSYDSMKILYSYPIYIANGKESKQFHISFNLIITLLTNGNGRGMK